MKLDKAHVEKQAERDELALGWYPFLARKFQLRQNEKTAHRSLDMQLAPMEDTEDAQSARYPIMFGNLDLADGAFKSKKAEKFIIQRTTAPGAALFEDVPGVPVKGGDGQYYVNGKPLGKGEYEPAMKAATLGVQAKLESLWNAAVESSGASLSKLNDSMVVYGAVVINEYDDKETGEPVVNRQIDHFSRELPPNARLVPRVQFVADDDEAPVAGDAASVAKSALKPAAKKSRK